MTTELHQVLAAQLNDAQQKRQAELSRLSSRGQHVIVPHATHMSLLMNPEQARLVTHAILELVNAVKDSTT